VPDDETPRYRKRAKKKTPKKTDHRHEFRNCVFLMPSIRFDEAHGIVREPDTLFSIGTFCPVCGKIGTTIDWEWISEDAGPRPLHWERCWSERARREFAESTRTLPCFHLDDEWFTKYVTL
jgi:hypothetical protein